MDLQLLNYNTNFFRTGQTLFNDKYLYIDTINSDYLKKALELLIKNNMFYTIPIRLGSFYSPYSNKFVLRELKCSKASRAYISYIFNIIDNLVKQDFGEEYDNYIISLISDLDNNLYKQNQFILDKQLTKINKLL